MLAGRRCLVLGASGQLGHALCAALRDGHTVIPAVRRPTGPDQARIDLEDPAGTVATLEALRPEWIFLAGAFCYVDLAEAQPDRCIRVNVEGPAAVAEYARRHHGLVVYYSTDQVFDGTRETYEESDVIHPLNVYARSKAQGEQVMRELLPDGHLVLRTAWLYGPDPARRNFALRLVDDVAASRSVTVPADQWGTPSYTEDLARASRLLADQDLRGTYHAVGPELVDRVSLARRICAQFQLNAARIVPAATSALAQAAVRPLRVQLSCRKLAAAHVGGFRGVAEGLQALWSWATPVATASWARAA